MLYGALHGTGVFTRDTGTPGAHITGTTTTVTIITGTIITTDITTTGTVPGTHDTMTSTIAR